MAEEPTPSPSILRRLYRSPWLVVFVGLLATMLLFTEGRKAALSHFRSIFEAGSTARATRAIHEMDEILSIMQALSHFIQRTDDLDRDKFMAMAAPFLLARKDLNGVAWVPAAGRTGSGFAESTAGRNKTIPRQLSDCYTVSYADPPDMGGEMAGTDLGSVPAFRSAMDRSRDTGDATASVWMGKSRPEFLIFLPIYAQGHILAKPGEGGRALRGFLLGSLHLDRVLSDFFTTAQPEGLTLEFLDYFTVPQGCAVYSRTMSPGAEKHPWAEALLPAQSPYVFKGAFAGRQWGIRVTPGRAYVEKFHNLSYWFILPTGFALTFLLALYRRSILSQWRTMERTIAERTAEVREHEQHLEELVRERTESLTWKTAFLEAIMETSWDGILVTDGRGKKILENRRAASLWGIPDSSAGLEDNLWTMLASSKVKKLDAFQEKVLHFLSSSSESLHDEVELLDGTVLETYSSSILGEDGVQYGRIWTFHDVTQRKSAEEALKRSEATLRSVFSATPVGIALIGIGRAPTWTSEGMLAITGYAPEEIVAFGPRILYATDEEYVRAGRALYAEVWAGGTGNVDTKWVHKDGRILDISLSGAAIDPANLSTGAVIAAVDITERKKAEEALKESENMFRDLAEKSVLGISLVQDGSYKYVNAQFAAIHGRTIEEMIDRPATLEHIHPEDVQRVSEHVGKADSRGHIPMEFRIVAKGGEVKTVLAYAIATMHQGRLAVMGTLLDVTGRKQAEEVIRENEVRLSHATNLAKIVYWEHDEIRQEFIFNDAFYALYGTTAEAEGGYRMSRDEYFRRFVHPEDLIEARTKADRNRGRPDGPAEVEHRVVRRDGSFIHILTRTKLFRDAEGRVVKAIGANQDVTERKKVEEALTWKTAFLEAQVNSSPDGILVIDSRGKTILRNQRMVDIWKLPETAAPGQEDRTQLDQAVSLAANPQAFREKVIFLLRHPDETAREEVKLKDGTALDVYSCPVLGKDGSHYGRIWTFRDVTELRRYWDMLESLSTTDGLTDLPNRRRFDEFLNREWRRSMRDQSLLSLIMMDIDFFKEFNDHYGHLAGDDCLRQVASVLREIVQRPGDLAARYGGEEFACILPDTDLDGALTVASIVMKRLEEANIPHFFSSVADHVTLSFGVTTLIPESGEAPSKLIQIADDLLYSAKQSGRDQVKSWRQEIFRRRVIAK